MSILYLKNFVLNNEPLYDWDAWVDRINYGMLGT